MEDLGKEKKWESVPRGGEGVNVKGKKENILSWLGPTCINVIVSATSSWKRKRAWRVKEVEQAKETLTVRELALERQGEHYFSYVLYGDYRCRVYAYYY